MEEVLEADHEGCKAALGSMEKVGITINRSDKEIGMCSNGARVNIAMHQVVKEQIGNHYMLVLYPNHKIDVAIHDAFVSSSLNALSETNLTNVYYLFCRENPR